MGKDDARDAELAGDRERVHGARAAERDHRRPPVVEPAFRRVDSKRPHHVLVRDLVHAPGGADRIESSGPRDVRLDGGACRIRIEAHLAAEKELGVEVAEHHVRVGQGRAGAALCVAGGPGVRPRALRPDPNETALVDPGERAPSGADLDHVDDRKLHRKSAPALELVDPPDLEVVLLERGEAAHQRPLRGGAAHVERQQVGKPELAPVMGGH